MATPTLKKVFLRGLEALNRGAQVEYKMNSARINCSRGMGRAKTRWPPMTAPNKVPIRNAGRISKNE